MALGVSAGCLDFSSGRCADGRICPEDWTCDEVNKLCIPPGCGDGEVRGTEQCDGERVPSDCTALGFYDIGNLACRPDCTFDTSGCSMRCGEHEVNGPEVCDGAPPPNQSCINYGYDIGRLDCSAACGPAITLCGQIGWYTAQSGTAVLHGLWGSGPNDMFAVGFNGTILHSTGGAWTQMTTNTDVDLYAVWGSGASNVFAVGAGGTILHYDGSSWTAMTSNTTNLLYGVYGIGSNEVFAVGGNTIVRFDGTSWTPRTEGTIDLRAVAAANGVAIAVGRSGVGRRYENGTWTNLTSVADHLYGIWMYGTTAFAVGQAGAVYQLNGTNWSRLGQLTGYDLLSVWGTSPTDVFIGGGYGKLFHYDGARFIAHDPDSTRSIMALWGISPDHVYGVTQGGGIQEYRGTRWIVDQAAAISDELYRVHGFDNGHAIAISHGSAYTQFDGTTWQATKSINGAAWMRSIWAKDEATVFIAADDTNGAGLYYGNYASGFTRVSSSALVGSPFAVWGASNGDLWTAGNAEYIWKGSVTNPSASWTRVYGSGASGPHDWRALWGSGPSDVFAVGDMGMIAHYDGTAWSPMVSPLNDAELDDVWGTAPDNVFAVGQQGTILHYNGTMWRLMTSGTAENLVSIRGAGPTDIFIAGVNNLILHYDGVSWSPVAPSVFGDFRGVAASATSYLFVGDFGASHRIERLCRAKEELCGDAWDDDCDGLINCADDDCQNDGFCTRGGACPRVADVGCDAAITGSTYTGIGHIDELRCTQRSTPGPEASYRFTAPPLGGSVTVEISDLGADLDLAVTGAFAMSLSCDLAQCITASNVSGTQPKSVTFAAAPGATYYFIVDGPTGIGADFQMKVSCQ